MTLHGMKTKLLAFAILVTLLPALALGFLSFWRYQALIGDETAHELRTVAGSASDELRSWERERVTEVRTIATSYAVIDALAGAAQRSPATPEVAADTLAAYLRAVQKRLGSLLELTVYDGDGQTVASSVPTPAPMVLPANWTSAAITEAAVLAPARRDAARGTAILTVVVPILSARNELQGAMTAALDLATFTPRLRQRLKARSDVSVLAADGAPLLRLAGAASGTALAQDIVQRLRAQPGTMLAVRTAGERDLLAVAEEPAGLPLVIVAAADQASIYEAWSQALQRYLWLVLLLTAAVGVATYALAHSIVAPLNRLIAAAGSVGRGDLNVELPVTHPDEIGYLTRMFNAMTSELRRSRADLHATGEMLRAQNELLARLAITDALTGLYNRAKIESILLDQFARLSRSRRPFAVLMLDIDDFKSINDTRGHAAGDAVLATLGKLLPSMVRTIDFVGRYGGEEFVIVLPDTLADEAMEAAERIRLQIEETPFVADAATVPVTASVGVAQSRDGDGGPEGLLARADAALYAAKRAGRNRVSRAE